MAKALFWFVALLWNFWTHLFGIVIFYVQLYYNYFLISYRMTLFTKVTAFVLIMSVINNVDAECYMNCAADHWGCFRTCFNQQCVICRDSQWQCFENCANQSGKRLISRYLDDGIKRSKQTRNLGTIDRSTKFIRYWIQHYLYEFSCELMDSYESRLYVVKCVKCAWRRNFVFNEDF